MEIENSYITYQCITHKGIRDDGRLLDRDLVGIPVQILTDWQTWAFLWHVSGQLTWAPQPKPEIALHLVGKHAWGPDSF